uniref:Uncharacterized protein n=1 Tax=mine drainage metagenome TaxID=410659 RepID=E6QLZ9_9ZZZZ
MPIDQADATGAADTSTAMADVQVTAHRIAEYLEFGGDPARAGKDIQSFADQQGDAAVLAIIDKLSDMDLSGILRQYDLTHTSPIQQVISPDRFAALVELEHKYAPGDYAELRGMLTGVLFAESDDTDDKHTTDCLEAMIWQPHAMELLAGMFVRHAEDGILNFWLYGSFLVTVTDADNDLWLRDCLNGHITLDLNVVRSRAAHSFGDYPDLDEEGLPHGSEFVESDTRFGMTDGDLQQLCWLLREHQEDFFMDMMLQVLRMLKSRGRAAQGRVSRGVA